MVLIYLESGAPGEAANALDDVGRTTGTFTRTVRGYDGPETDARRVYTDDDEIRDDYKEIGVEVKSLSAPASEETSEGVPSEGDAKEESPATANEEISSEDQTGGIDLSQTKIGSMGPQDMTRDELYSIAQDLGISGRSGMRKQELFNAIREKRRSQ